MTMPLPLTGLPSTGAGVPTGPLRPAFAVAVRRCAA